MMFFNDFEDFLKEADELMAKLIEEATQKEEKDNNSQSYYHSISDKFENGRHVSHQEKEVKNGKVLKDVHQENCRIEDKKEKENEEPTKDDTQNWEVLYKAALPEITKLKKLLDETKENHKIVCNKYDSLMESYRKLKAENNRLQRKLDSIKTLFE